MNATNYGYPRLGRSLLIALSIIGLAVGCAPPVAPRSEVARPVKTMVVDTGGDSHVRAFPGKVEASKKAVLSFQVPGVLVKLPVKEGQKVVQGEVIAQLRQDEFQARLKAVQGQLDQARAVLKGLRSGERPEQILRLEAQARAAETKLANARAEFDRAATLLPSRAVSQSDYDLAETTLRVAQEDHQAALQMLEKGSIARSEDIEAKEAVVRGLEGRVVEANLQLEDCTLRAPYDGVIAQRFVNQEQSIRANEPVVKFQNVDEIEVAMDVPEAVMAADIRSADIVQMIAEFSGAPGLRFPVHVTEVAQLADPATQTFKVRVAMEAVPGLNVFPGMTATVTATYRRATVLGSGILVPISAVLKEASGEQVAWVIGPDQAVKRRVVKIGEATGGQIEIVDGLRPGDRIAVAGVTHLRDAMKVRDLGDGLGGGQP